MSKKKNGATPDEELMVACDFSEVSRRWAHEWMKMDGEIQQWAAVQMGDGRDDLSDEEQEKLNAGKLEAAIKMNELLDRRNELAAMVLVSVPREWLVKDAPDEIDWSDPENLLDYVKDKHNHDLLAGITRARMREAKNSQGTTSTASNTPD